MKTKIIYIILVAILLINFVSSEIGFFVRPLENGELQKDRDILYEFSFNTDSACSNIIFTNRSNIRTNRYGDGYYEVSVPVQNDLLEISYLCQYKNNLLQSSKSLSDAFYNRIYAKNVSTKNLRVEGIVNLSSTIIIDNHTDIKIFNDSNKINNSWNQSLANTLFAPNTTAGIQSLINGTLENHTLTTFTTYNDTWDNSWVNTFSNLWYNHTLSTYNIWNDIWSSTFNSTYENNIASINTTYNIGVLYNSTASMIANLSISQQPASGVNYWGSDGTNLWNLTAFVGIGTENPNSLLEITSCSYGNVCFNASGVLYVNDSKVGIGTPAVGSDKLTVDGFVSMYDSANNAGVLKFKNISNNYKDGFIYGNSLSFSTATTEYGTTSAERVFISDITGDVGIGTNTPIGKLDVRGQGNFSSVIYFNNNTRVVGIQDVYPVGSIYLSVVSTNPNTLFGFGTWVAFSTGRYLVGMTTGGAAEETIGTALSDDENRATGLHTHADTFAISPNPHSHTFDVHQDFGDTNVPLVGAGIVDGTPSTDGTSLSITGAVSNSASPNNVAGTPAPYIKIYMWKRTA